MRKAFRGSTTSRRGAVGSPAISWLRRAEPARSASATERPSSQMVRSSKAKRRSAGSTSSSAAAWRRPSRSRQDTLSLGPGRSRSGRSGETEGRVRTVNFAVTADAYDRFMGKYSILLGPQLADYAGVRSGQRVIDVGCGPGALTRELVQRVGAKSVSAIDPSESFVTAARERFPGVDVRLGSAEQIPFPDNA